MIKIIINKLKKKTKLLKYKMKTINSNNQLVKKHINRAPQIRIN